jgi:transcriptional regulator with XRE-family HTH domain
MEDRYSRNRAELAREAFISPSALSQYVRGKSTPSLEVLVQLATVLDVSLDYLVFGEQIAPSTVGEASFLAGQVEMGLRDAQRQSAELHDLVARIGARLAREVRAAAEEVLPRAKEASGGSLDALELMALERFSQHTRIANYHLELDVVMIKSPEAGSIAAPGQVGQVIIDNIKEGKEYEYVLPDGPEFTQRAILLHELAVREARASRVPFMERQLQLFQSPHGCLPGFVVHHVDILALEHGARDIYDRVAPFFYLDRENPGKAFLGAVIPPSASTQSHAIVTSRSVQKLIDEHAWLKSISHRVTVRSHHRPASDEDQTVVKDT